MNKLLSVSLFFLLLCGCGGVRIVPDPAADARLDPQSGDLTMTRDDLRVSVRLQDLQVRPYQAVDHLCSFYVSIRNEGERTRDIVPEAFVLIDAGGNQYRSITPEKVIEIISRESFYLIPYPYVGFYYLEDSVKVSQFSRFDSSLPYFPQRYPQDLHTAALPQDRLLPDSRLAGQIYFIADLTAMDAFELRYNPEHPSGAESGNFSFSFSVEKK